MWGSKVLDLYQHVSVCLSVCVDIIHLWQWYNLCHTSWGYDLLWQVYILLTFSLKLAFLILYMQSWSQVYHLKIQSQIEILSNVFFLQK